jgi:hypothetical protein
MEKFRSSEQEPPAVRRVNDIVVQRLEHVYEIDPDRMRIIQQQSMPVWDTLRIVSDRLDHLRWMHDHWADAVLSGDEIERQSQPG